MTVSAAAPGYSEGDIIDVGEDPNPPLAGDIILTDPATGITVIIPRLSLPEGVTDVTLVVIQDGNTYDIILLDQDGNEFVLIGEVEIIIPISGNVISVVDANGHEVPGAIWSNGFVSFKTENLGKYALVYADSSPAEKTGDAMMMYIMWAGIALVGATGIIFATKKQKNAVK